jgi:hypothetical protein
MSPVLYCAAVGSEPETYSNPENQRTWWEAAQEAIDNDEENGGDDATPIADRIVTVAIARRPTSPAVVIAADGFRLVEWLRDKIENSDEYQDDCCALFLTSVSPEATFDLAVQIRATLEAWFSRHNLEPTWYLAEAPREIPWPWIKRAHDLAAALDAAGRVRSPNDGSCWFTPACVDHQAIAVKHGLAAKLRTHTVWQAALDAGLMTAADFATAPKLP